MYRLTSRMVQSLERDLRKYHDLFQGGRCSGWELEELVVRAIKGDTSANHQARWRESGHDDKADIIVTANGDEHLVQVKSGQWVRKNNPVLHLSGHRLGRFEKNADAITDYLNNPVASMLAIPCKKVNDERGRTFTYEVSYISKEYLVGLRADAWVKLAKQWKQTNEHGVEFSITGSMSWQIWWKIPREHVDVAHRLSI
ncbi:MAG: hypothetical protein MPK11_08645 [Gammaproteobacteria bacterium]|nr:hypothetical protein [Gammaproteobacteria bacterium]CAJ2377242.1 MAG: putative Phosphomannomutase [Arenicellales bacterium IbO2]MDA7962348.1 hypothetical protein [Gammaproteobacteria bacterium]MDA7970819.1 hypothetical protein [Gammaproteobacteria bacterium]MDA7971581.1 hypothetical protein [Gammaproteobacteria bacterium]